jgi:hypothetical protein
MGGDGGMRGDEGGETSIINIITMSFLLGTWGCPDITYE